ncbi:MAG: hypothetical protein AAF566_11790 [Pseudomonadota bacterium]
MRQFRWVLEMGIPVLTAGDFFIDQSFDDIASHRGLGPDAQSLLRNAAGRYDVSKGNLTSQRFKTLTLRFDADDFEVSCDLFDRDPPKTRRSLLGGRSDWHSSWRGRISDCRDTADGRVAFLATCARYTVDSKSGRPDETTAEVNIEIDKATGRLLSASGRVAHDKAIIATNAWHADMSGLPAGKPFRRIRLNYLVLGPALTELCDADPTAPSQDEVLGQLFEEQGPASIPGAFAGDVDVTARKLDDIPLARLAASATFDDVTANVLAEQALRIGQAAQEDQPWDWECLLVFAGLGFQQAPPGNFSRLVIGRAHGFSNPRDRFRSRYGAIINTTRVKDEVGKSQASGVHDITWSLRHYALHEIGHLLNLPHPWRRVLGERSLGPDDPGALTWMNYASRHPYAQIAAVKLAAAREESEALGNGHGVDAAEALVAKRRDHFFEQLGMGRFSRTERQFIRHAPLDQIAQGGRTFLDHNVSTPAMMPAADVPVLQIGVFFEGVFHRVSQIAGLEWTRNGRPEELAPVPLFGRIFGDLTRDENAQVPSLEVMLQTGAVQLIVQEDTAVDPLLGETRQTEAYDPPQADRDAFNAGRFAGLASVLDASDPAQRKRIAALPWIRRDPLRSLFTIPGKRYRCQIQYFGNGQTVASNVVYLDFEQSRPLEPPLEPEDGQSDEDFYSPFKRGRGVVVTTVSDDGTSASLRLPPE